MNAAISPAYVYSYIIYIRSFVHIAFIIKTMFWRKKNEMKKIKCVKKLVIVPFCVYSFEFIHFFFRLLYCLCVFDGCLLHIFSLFVAPLYHRLWYLSDNFQVKIIKRYSTLKTKIWVKLYEVTYYFTCFFSQRVFIAMYLEIVLLLCLSNSIIIMHNWRIQMHIKTEKNC